ncbi:polyprenyl synthetase family protein [Streptomyces ficellus]|uniref:Polyprenyl synthetase family protein n=2 Tax=Streptomyces ficellus TaxID=1977088 RepID=A0ABT7Z6J5_9ACTN|nr:polyprenyl synthetase family protein [Streptomyces ficellus]MDN3294897.1 polyprenyl synthetase family protein [Streptomyces ficellus]
MAGYHFGWLDVHGHATKAAAGKALRPALAFACAEAVGGRADDALGPGVAVELVHAFSLIHDDIIDRDQMRRHRPTVWKAFGVPAALLAGDALLAAAHLELTRPSCRRPAACVEVLTQAVLELIEGEATDVAFEKRCDVTLAEYRVMAAGKTGALIAAACQLGALAAGAGPKRAQRLAGFGHHLGMAFQITDDLLGIFGDPQTTGKPVGGDLVARKKTYPVLAALTARTAAARQLRAFYAAEGAPRADDVGQAVSLVEQAGGADAARDAVRQETQQALAILREAVDVNTAAYRDLTALADLMSARTA